MPTSSYLPDYVSPIRCKRIIPAGMLSFVTSYSQVDVLTGQSANGLLSKHVYLKVNDFKTAQAHSKRLLVRLVRS